MAKVFTGTPEDRKAYAPLYEKKTSKGWEVLDWTDVELPKVVQMLQDWRGYAEPGVSALIDGIWYRVKPKEK